MTTLDFAILDDRASLARWGMNLLLVLALHGAATMLLVTWKKVAEPIFMPAAPVMLDLAPASAPAPRHQAEAAPAPQEATPAPLPPLVKPAVAVVPKKPPKSRSDRPKPVEPRNETPVQQREAVAAAPPSIALAAPAVPAPALAAPSTNARTSFEAQVFAHLERFKRYPRQSQIRGEQGIVYLRFIMDRAGKILAFRLDRSSGHAALDAEVLALIRRAEPLPSVPADREGAELELMVPISFTLR